MFVFIYSPQKFVYRVYQKKYRPFQIKINRNLLH